jgi:hypothetical protein
MDFKNYNDNLYSLYLEWYLESELKFRDYIKFRECTKMKIYEI